MKSRWILDLRQKNVIRNPKMIFTFEISRLALKDSDVYTDKKPNNTTIKYKWPPKLKQQKPKST